MKPELNSDKKYTALEVFEMVQNEIMQTNRILGIKKLREADKVVLNIVHSAFRRDEIISQLECLKPAPPEQQL
jgi:hypothetical protein